MAGILGDLPVYDDEREEMAARIKISLLERHHWDSPFQKSLVEFARARKVSLLNPDWKCLALSIAAREHPDLQSKRRRGRPAKAKYGFGILGGPYFHDQEAIEWVNWIDERNELRNAEGLPSHSDKTLAYKLAESLPNKEKQAVESKAQQFRNRMAKARKFLGRSKKPREAK